ncbi:hypothetical protein AAVH_24013 [Aphelenchoides avenae]|nr:hypothetical protein AAVH_24013 [Aphelenchus avenae]
MGPADTNTVLEQFVLYRRKIAYERLHTHYQSGQKTIGETDVMHHVELGLRETQMLNRILSGAHPYDTISHEDRNTLFAEYSLCWTIEENVFSTIRNGGHISRRMHHVDGSYIQLNEDGAFRHWAGLYPMITNDDRDAVFNALVRFFFAAAIHLTSHVTLVMVRF